MKDVYNIRYRSLVKIAGWLLLLESAMMIIPLLTALLSDGRDCLAFLSSMIVAGLTGGLAVILNRGEHTKLYRREGYLLISFIWIVFSLFGMIPFMLCDYPLDTADAFFETISGFTTTGATVISDVESLGNGILLWRSMIQWLGGLGIVLFLIAILPALNDTGGIALFNAEITGISHDKLHPQIRKTAISLWGVYSILTITMIPLLMVGGMDFFDSVCQSMTTLSTGGYSTRNISIGQWHSSYIASVVTLFMLLGGVNFILLYNFAVGRKLSAFKNEVFKVYIAVVTLAAAVMSLSLLSNDDSTFDNLVVAPLFHVVSSITSTGFTYADFSSWGTVTLILTFVLMICGACAGSTTGGIKIDRLCVLFKNIKNEIVNTLYPKRLKFITISGKTVEESTLVKILAFMSLYLLLLLAGALLMSAYGYTFVDSFFASASCIGNNGLGFGVTGSGYGSLPDSVKWMFSFLMLVGRLEIFTVLVLFYSSFWKR